MALTVLVCGGRDFHNLELVMAVLDSLPVQITKIINGAAKGADRASSLWARERGIEFKEYPADWSLGKKAGILRNAEMLQLEKIDLVVAFPGNNGTRDMMNRSKAAGIEVIAVKIFDGKPRLFSSFSKTKSQLNFKKD